jgi:hypothetical protein
MWILRSLIADLIAKTTEILFAFWLAGVVRASGSSVYEGVE